jgi:hypothetical protein
MADIKPFFANIKMKSNNICVFKRFLFITLILVACNDKREFAPERNFYFEVLTNDERQSTKELVQFLRREIPKAKYTITNHSGLAFPFYKALNPKEKIVKDSLMPPHWFVHRMIPYEKTEIKKDEFLVKIFVMPDQCSIPNYRIDIFKMDSTGLTLSGKADVHYIDSTEFDSKKALLDLYLKSVIRYSFK